MNNTHEKAQLVHDLAPLRTQTSEKPPLKIEDLPLTATIAQVAQVLGFSRGQVRSLVQQNKIAHIKVGSRVMIPRDAIARYLAENTVQPCQDEIQDLAFASSRNVPPITSSGLKMAAAASVQRALRIASSLNPPSQTSSMLAHVTPGRESQKKS